MLCIPSGKEEWNKKEDFIRGPYLLVTVPVGDADSQQLSYFIKPSIIQRVLEYILKHHYFTRDTGRTRMPCVDYNSSAEMLCYDNH